MGKQEDEEQHPGDDGNSPNHPGAPFRVDSMEVVGGREGNQHRYDEPAVVQAQFYSEHPRQLDLRSHVSPPLLLRRLCYFSTRPMLFMMPLRPNSKQPWKLPLIREVGAVVEARGFSGGNKRQILNFPRWQLCI